MRLAAERCQKGELVDAKYSACGVESRSRQTAACAIVNASSSKCATRFCPGEGRDAHASAIILREMECLGMYAE
jgi:hypothetical protein